MEFSLNDAVVREEYNEGQKPGDRIRKQKDLVGLDAMYGFLIVGKNGVHPDKTQTAAADDGGEHGEDGTLDTTEDSGTAVHKAAKEIRYYQHQHTGHAVIHADRGVRQIDPKKRMTEKISQNTKRESDGRDGKKRGTIDRVETIVFLRTVVLSGKSHAALSKRIHAGIDERVDIHAGAVTGRTRSTEGVYGGLDDNV